DLDPFLPGAGTLQAVTVIVAHSRPALPIGNALALRPMMPGRGGMTLEMVALRRRPEILLAGVFLILAMARSVAIALRLSHRDRHDRKGDGGKDRAGKQFHFSGSSLSMP